MDIYEYTSFTHQKRSADTVTRGLVDQAINTLKARADLVGLTKITSVQRLSSIFNSVNLGLNHWARRQDAYEIVVGPGPYRIYFFATQNGTLSLLALARESGAGIREYFGSWKLDHLPEDSRQVFAGTWPPPQGVNNVVDMNSNEALIFDHNNKHFGGEGPAQYYIGEPNRRKQIVAGMEKTAMEWGISLPGEVFFLFDRVVGKDGIGRGGGSDAKAIRIDSPGGESQHSHPVPEDSCQQPNQTDKFYSALEMCCRNRDIDGFVRLAKYCRVIGARVGLFKIGQNRKAAFGVGEAQIRPPECVYWPWG
jgi:hypothetical protein